MTICGARSINMRMSDKQHLFYCRPYQGRQKMPTHHAGVPSLCTEGVRLVLQ